MWKSMSFVLLFLCVILFWRNTQARYVTKNDDDDVKIVSRDEWCAQPPNGIQCMSNPVPFVIIHHSASPPACTTEEECVEAMRDMQAYHQETQGWLDIGYSFAVGGDFRAYQGRGWSVVGAHAPSYNDKSIGICVIGDWREELPPAKQLTVVKNLIDYGVRLGKIDVDYKLVGHRQVRNGTVCPGDALFEEIKTWEHYEDYPDMANATYKPKKAHGTKYFSVKEASAVMNEFRRGRQKCEPITVVDQNDNLLLK